MVELIRDPDEVAVWRTLLDAADGDHLTLVELAAVASAAAGQRVGWFAASMIVNELYRRGCVTRTVVQRTGQPRQRAYALNDRGRRRVARLLA